MTLDIPQTTPQTTIPQPSTSQPIRQQGIEFELIDYFPIVGLITALNRNENRVVSSDADYAKFHRYLKCHFITTVPLVACAIDYVLR